MRCINLVVICFLSGVLNIGFSRGQEFDPAPFLKPLKLSNESITHFYKCYNHPWYTKRILPSCFFNVIDLLSYTKTQEDPYNYAYLILNLFHQRFKDCKWDNALAFAQLLDRLPGLIGYLFIKKPDAQTLETYLESRIYSPAGLTVPAHELKAFIQQLARDTYEYSLQPMIASYDLRQITTRFLESMLDKTIWDSSDGIQTWKYFKLIGHQLELLYESHIVGDLDTLNDLIWSLVYRFCYFIELSGSALPLTCYTEMQTELAAGAVDFLNYQEQDDLIRPKIKVLAHALQLGNAKALAYTKNILTDAVI